MRADMRKLRTGRNDSRRTAPNRAERDRIVRAPMSASAGSARRVDSAADAAPEDDTRRLSPAAAPRRATPRGTPRRAGPSGRARQGRQLLAPPLSSDLP